MKLPAFQFYADDFLAGTLDMSPAEVGAYIRLLCHQWARGDIPVADADKLARIAGGLVSDDVLAKFPNGKNERLERVRVRQAEFRDLQSRKGKASAKARFNRGSTGTQPNHQPKLNSPSPSPSPISVSSLQTNTLAPAVPRERNEIFDTVVEVTGQNAAMSGGEIGKAIKAIRTVTPNLTPDEIRRRAANYKTQMPHVTMSAGSLAKWWTKCDGAGLLPTNGALESRFDKF